MEKEKNEAFDKIFRRFSKKRSLLRFFSYEKQKFFSCCSTRLFFFPENRTISGGAYTQNAILGPSLTHNFYSDISKRGWSEREILITNLTLYTFSPRCLVWSEIRQENNSLNCLRHKMFEWNRTWKKKPCPPHHFPPTTPFLFFHFLSYISPPKCFYWFVKAFLSPFLDLPALEKKLLKKKGGISAKGHFNPSYFFESEQKFSKYWFCRKSFGYMLSKKIKLIRS